ncbi:MAG: 2-C-methyl-D-erythritol 4-phosphate cytidylyltransferase [Planctomycetota bacterium]
MAESSPQFAVVLVAAGRSTRFSGVYKKPFAPLDGRAVWLHSAERFVNRDDVSRVVVVVSDEDREEFDQKFGANVMILGLAVCRGGKERADSVRSGLAKVGDAEFVAVHDAARPCVTDKEIDSLFDRTRATGAAILASPVASTLKRVESTGEGAMIGETVPRVGLWAAQTPQAFRRDLLERAYAADDVATATDDAQLVERLGERVAIVEGSPLNLKITTKADLKLAEQILRVKPPPKSKGVNPFADDDLWR